MKARIINVNFVKSVKNTAKNNAKRISLATATAAMCVSLGLTVEESEAAKAALRDIANDEGARQARAIVVDMARRDNAFNGFLA